MLDLIEVNTHSSIRIALEKVIYIDPFRLENAPHDADIILITHSHFDHLSPEDIRRVMRPDTVLVCPHSVTEADALGLTVQKVGTAEQFTVRGIRMETVPAYNRTKQFHPREKGWVGYLIDGGSNGHIFIAGDTDMTDENSRVRCRIAMLPIGGTYTVDAAEAAALANAIGPEFVIPVHYGSIAGSPEDLERFRGCVDPHITVVPKIRKF